MLSTLQAEQRSPDLVVLDADHPGFHDRAYRARRDRIATMALEYTRDMPVPHVAYTEQEQGVWREVWRNLEPLHARYACREYVEASRRIRFSRERIPQLAEANAVIGPLFGFRMMPVAGLVTAGAFLRELADGVFLSTQYMRHHSVPLYTPEPDVVHELIGHAATFAHPRFVELNRAFGEAALRADAATMEQIERLYWYTLEFGVVREGEALKVFGAGLLSSFGELGRFERDEPLAEWNVDRIAATPYDPTHYQSTLFVAPSFDVMFRDVVQWLQRI
jgi:phenylalanine-4-hydroxylase